MLGVGRLVSKKVWRGAGAGKACMNSVSVAQAQHHQHQHDNHLVMPKFDYMPEPYRGPSAHEILAKQSQYLVPSLFHFYDKPLNIVEGKMQYLYDEDGHRYLGTFRGIVTISFGHCHPDIVDVIVKQTKLLQHTTSIYLNHTMAKFAEALANKLPGNLKVVMFVNSGTEANELVIMMARLYTRNYDMIGVRNSYHGSSSITMALTGQSNFKYNTVQV